MKYFPVKNGERVTPVMKGYRMACCDCGLVHVIDFDVTRVVESANQRAGYFNAKPTKPGAFRVGLTAYRDERKTAAHRREKAKR